MTLYNYYICIYYFIVKSGSEHLFFSLFTLLDGYAENNASTDAGRPQKEGEVGVVVVIGF